MILRLFVLHAKSTRACILHGSKHGINTVDRNCELRAEPHGEFTESPSIPVCWNHRILVGIRMGGYVRFWYRVGGFSISNAKNEVDPDPLNCLEEGLLEVYMRILNFFY